MQKTQIVKRMRIGKPYLSKFAASAVLALIILPAGVRAQAVQHIAAIVNDELITAYDLESRMKLVILSTRLPNTVEVRRRIRNQVLRSLIDERLQMQEAAPEYFVGKRDLRSANRPSKSKQVAEIRLERMLQNDVPLAAMEEQLRAGIAWSKLVDADCVRALPSARTK